MGTKDIPNIGHQKVGTSQTAKRIVNQSKEFRHGTSLVVPWLRLRLQVVQVISACAVTSSVHDSHVISACSVT